MSRLPTALSRSRPIPLRHVGRLAFDLPSPVGVALGLRSGSSLRCPKMKRIGRRVLLVVLVLLELLLLTGFLPERWQKKMYSRMDGIWPSHSYDYSRVTHPNLDYELQPLKPYVLALVAVLVVLIYAVWRWRDS